jgi:hypothetical protein
MAAADVGFSPAALSSVGAAWQCNQRQAALGLINACSDGIVSLVVVWVW